MQNLRPHPDSQSQNLHFKKILRWFISTLKSEKYQKSHTKQFNWGQEKLPNPFEKMKEISKQQGVDVTNSYIMQGCHSGVKHEYQNVLLEKKKEATFVELE